MLNEILLAAAAAGGTTIVQAVATDAWAMTKASMTGLFSRGGRVEPQAIEAQLDADAALILGASESDRNDISDIVAQAWQERIANLLSDAPERVEALGELVRIVEMVGATTRRTPDYHQVNVIRESSTGFIVQGGTQRVESPQRPED